MKGSGVEMKKNGREMRQYGARDNSVSLQNQRRRGCVQVKEPQGEKTNITDDRIDRNRGRQREDGGTGRAFYRRRKDHVRIMHYISAESYST